MWPVHNPFSISVQIIPLSELLFAMTEYIATENK
jgi:hypothetical protein